MNRQMDVEEIRAWLMEDEPVRLCELWQEAETLRKTNVGDAVHLRGLIEFSNHCSNACIYCGLWSGNIKLQRYTMLKEEILDCVALAEARGFKTVVLQSGEIHPFPVEWLARVVREIKSQYSLAVTLSVGEHSLEAYSLWRDMGADRYLLKWETSDRELYRRYHPFSRGLSDRIAHLEVLRHLGYEIGSGVMVGLPDQTYRSLARDLHLFRKFDLDMIAVGPYIPHPDTPLGSRFLSPVSRMFIRAPNSDLMTRKVIALARILCPNANIPATTALATVDADGYKNGLGAGANVIMPNLTPMFYRSLYDVYPRPAPVQTEDLIVSVDRIIRDAGRWIGQTRGDRIRQETIDPMNQRL